jgi:ribonuclease VapC
MADAVLDASAVLAVVLGECGADRVWALPEALISAVNYAEVVSKLIDLGVPPEVAVVRVAQLAAEVAPMDEAAAFGAALLRATTRARGLSLGDRACLALAKARGLPAVTADRAWASVDAGVEIVLIR